MTATALRATSAAGWHDDPTGRYLYRYWDGASWTSAVSDGTSSATDPVSAAPPETSSIQASAATPQATQSSAAAGHSKIEIAAATVIAVTLAVFVVVIFIAAIGTGPANDDSLAGTDAPAVTETPNSIATP